MVSDKYVVSRHPIHCCHQPTILNTTPEAIETVAMVSQSWDTSENHSYVGRKPSKTTDRYEKERIGLGSNGSQIESTPAGCMNLAQDILTVRAFR
jgi:hypothetical protein